KRGRGKGRKGAGRGKKERRRPGRSIRRNVELGLEIDGRAAGERRAITEEMLEKCHLAGFAEHSPFQLSGGMRQRAALAQ
ncbi:ABC transporter ATP-binding protein, partial [Pseudomonas aeruginosa]